MFSAIKKTSSAIDAILSHKSSYTKVIFLRLCGQSSCTISDSRIWNKATLIIPQKFTKRYKHFVTCRKYSTDAYENILNELKYVPQYVLVNKTIHSFFETSTRYTDSIIPPLKTKPEVNYEEICQLHILNYSQASTLCIYDAFKTIAYCYVNGSRFDSSLYNNILEAGIKILPKLNDKQLLTLMSHLVAFVDDIMGLDSWKLFLDELNKECLKRFYPSNRITLLKITDAFFQLSNKESDYMWRSLRKLSSKMLTLSETELPQTLFYLNYCKFPAKVNTFEVIYRFKQIIHRLSIIEIGIITRYLFLRKTRINDSKLLSVIIQKTKQNIETINSITLTSIMKIIRFSNCHECRNEFEDLLVSLRKEIPRLSLKCLTHIIHTISGVNVYDETLVQMCFKRIENEIQFLRLKDIERILISMHLVTPKTAYYQKIYQLLLNEVFLNVETTRSAEINKFPTSLVRIILNAVDENMYLPEQIQYVMEPKFLNKLFKKSLQNLTSDLLVLHCSVKINFPQYTGPLLPEKIYDALIKKYIRKNESNEMQSLLHIKSDIVSICKKNLGLNVYVDYVVPHYLMKHIVIGLDEQNKSVEIEPILSSMPEGSIKFVNSEELKKIKWYVVHIVRSAQKIIGRDDYKHTLYDRINQLNRIGYIVLPLHATEWNQLPNDEAKENFLKKLIYDTRDQNSVVV